MRHAVQVVLVSDQPTANLTPALDHELRPDRVVLVESPQMRQHAEWLAGVLGSAGLTVERWSVEDAFDVEHLRDRMLDLVVALDGQDAALNVTGGTKPMAVAAYEAFRQMERPIFYVHPETDRLVWLFHEGSPRSHDVEDRIKLGPFLAAHGAPVEAEGVRDGVPRERRELADALIRASSALGPVLARLNWLANSARGSLISEPVRRRSDELDELVAVFAKVGSVCWRGDRLEFASEAERFFVNGGWLEEHVFGVVYRLRHSQPWVQDAGRSIVVRRDVGGKPVRNELDVAFLANNRLHVIECKTKRFAHTEAEAAGETGGSEVLYKLDAITDALGGLHARGMVISFLPLHPAELRRAEALGIEVVSGVDVEQLHGRIEAFAAGVAAASAPPTLRS